jgi:hypothetical protein
MWPILYSGKASLPFTMEDSPLHTVAKRLAKHLMGDDMEFDFDMLISKVTGTYVNSASDPSFRLQTFTSWFDT